VACVRQGRRRCHAESPPDQAAKILGVVGSRSGRKTPGETPPDGAYYEDYPTGISCLTDDLLHQAVCPLDRICACAGRSFVRVGSTPICQRSRFRQCDRTRRTARQRDDLVLLPGPAPATIMITAQLRRPKDAGRRATDLAQDATRFDIASLTCQLLARTSKLTATKVGRDC